MLAISELLRSVWHFVREMCGENDYARCCSRARVRGEEPPTPEAFYLAKLHRKYCHPSRCC